MVKQSQDRSTEKDCAQVVNLCSSKFKSKIAAEASQVNAQSNHVINEASQVDSDDKMVEVGHVDKVQLTEPKMAQELRPTKLDSKDRSELVKDSLLVMCSDEKQSNMKLFGQDASTAVKSNIMPASEEVAQNHAHKLADEECLNFFQQPDFVDHLNVFM